VRYWGYPFMAQRLHVLGMGSIALPYRCICEGMQRGLVDPCRERKSVSLLRIVAITIDISLICIRIRQCWVLVPDDTLTQRSD